MKKTDDFSLENKFLYVVVLVSKSFKTGGCSLCMTQIDIYINYYNIPRACLLYNRQSQL